MSTLGNTGRLPLKRSEALKRIKKAISANEMVFTIHSQQEMAEANANKFDVLYVSRTGNILRDPEWNSQYKNWKYRIEGPDDKGEWLTVIAAIDETDRKVHFVTVF